MNIKEMRMKIKHGIMFLLKQKGYSQKEINRILINIFDKGLSPSAYQQPKPVEFDFVQQNLMDIKTELDITIAGLELKKRMVINLMSELAKD